MGCNSNFNLKLQNKKVGISKCCQFRKNFNILWAKSVYLVNSCESGQNSQQPITESAHPRTPRASEIMSCEVIVSQILHIRKITPPFFYFFRQKLA